MTYRARRKIGSLVILGVAVYMVVALSRNLMDFSGSDDRVEEMEGKVADLRAENERLKRMAERVDTQEFEELMIRDKLGLVKPGEMVAILPQEYLKDQEDQHKEEGMREEVWLPNWQKWWNLFWGK